MKRGEGYHMSDIEIRKNGIAYGYCSPRKWKPIVRLGACGRKPASNPPCIVECAQCRVHVLAKTTSGRTRYWDPEDVLHAHQPARYNVSEEEARDFA